MGSVPNQNPWAPYYDNYRDCSLGICSIYCPQFCNLIFPPPPLSDDESPPFSPLIIAIIGVLASAFLLVSYYTIVTRFCKRRNVHSEENEENHVEMNHDQWPVQPVGLDEGLIKAITVCKYKKGDGLIEGSECAVCLSEFQENESLRLLPKCDHAFHLPCIDTWLKSHSNCPLCRAGVVLSHPIFNTNAYEVQRPNDLILVVDDHCDQRVVLSDDQENENAEDLEMKEENMLLNQEVFRRSISLGTFSDVLKIDEDLQVGIGSSKGFMRSPVAMKRSISTGRFNYKGKDSILSK